jgi:hypothetical protein
MIVHLFKDNIMIKKTKLILGQFLLSLLLLVGCNLQAPKEPVPARPSDNTSAVATLSPLAPTQMSTLTPSPVIPTPMPSATPTQAPATPTPVPTSMQTAALPSFFTASEVPSTLLTSAPAENIHLMGILHLNYDWYVDLDSGKIWYMYDVLIDEAEEKPSQAVDIHFGVWYRESKTEAYIVTRHRLSDPGVEVSYLFDTDEQNLTFEYCQEWVKVGRQGLLFIPLEGSAQFEPRRGCLITSEGRLAAIEVTEVDPFGPDTMTISFVVWEKR